jgi:hypothetical protein
MSINPTIKNVNEQEKYGHENHMSGISYDIKNPINQLRIVCSSCFFGEPKYYDDDNEINKKIRASVAKKSSLKVKDQTHLDYTLGSILSIDNYRSYTSSKLIETVIDIALDFSPEETLKEAARIRNEENIRTTPQIIMVRAANHPKVRGTSLISQYYSQIMKRTDEASVQLAYQIQCFGKPIPNSLKKAWKKFLEERSEYDLAKYRMENRKFKTVDVVNLTRAFSTEIDSLMKGTLKLSEEDTWEALISKEGSSKKTWTKAIPLMGHMALLKNLRNFCANNVDTSLYLPKLVNTAKNGKQLPFRYYVAYLELQKLSVSSKILDAVEECLEISLGQLPQFKGKVMSLCDNSGSAQGATTSAIGTTKVSTIANLTSILTGRASEDGYIGVFGDKLIVQPIRKKGSVFDQLDNADKLAKDIGQGTENGIWLFFDNAIKTKEHWDHIFVYSDMQAGHGGLYGTTPSEYSQYKWNNSKYIDVAKLIKTYRANVNPNVHIYLVQVAGYSDTLVPEFYDKTYILGGWSDSVIKFAHKLSSLNDNQSSLSLETSQPVVSVKKSRLKK